MKTIRLRVHQRMAIGAALFSATLAFGQATSQSTALGAAASTAEEDEEVVVLSPFEVTAESDEGYLATETLAGTRLRTSLRDVGSAISVVTEQFLTDVGATDNSTLLQYTTNTEVAGTHGTYAGLGNGVTLDENDTLRAPGGAQRVRGLASADNTRDFYVTDIPWDSYNVDRIDIQRGPNGILFGLGSPAGIINASLSNAAFDTFGKVSGRIGSYGSWRGNLDYNQEVVEDVFAIRVAALEDREKFRQDPAFENDERYYGAVRFDPKLFADDSYHTSIKLKYEHGDIDANRPRVLPPIDNISPWFRPINRSGTNFFGGMGKTPVNNGYDAWRTDDDIVLGDGRGLQRDSTVNFQPFLGGMVNQQQPYWLLDGATGGLYAANGGHINPGARLPDGSTLSGSDGIQGRRYADQFFGIRSLPGAANAAGLPNADLGQYHTQSLTDPTIFDFYNKLIDGPNKSEFETWDAYNFDFSQTAMDDRLGFQLTYDRQKYERGGSGFLDNPEITIDILQNFQDYYLTTDNPHGDITNANYGRPYTTSTFGGQGNSYESDREYMRGSVFAELRAEDMTNNDFLVKLIGKHRFNGVYSTEDYKTENRSWYNTANSREWAGYWNGNAGFGSAINDRPPRAFVYLGSSLADVSSASGANIPAVTAPLEMPDANIYVFDSNWSNFAVPFDDSWTIPDEFIGDAVDTGGIVYNPTGFPTAQGEWKQSNNPYNYNGWGASFPMKLMRYNNGADESLLRNAQLSQRETTSWAASWQGFWWNDAIVTTVGWRNDEVKGRGYSAQGVSTNRSILNLSPDVYRLPDMYPASQIFRDDSTSWGVVAHLNRFFPDDPLPINVSLSYSESSNFQVTDTRRNIYGKPIPNPTGETEDWGITLSTKDNKYSFRAIKYETKLFGANSELSNQGGVASVVRQGLRFRNVFLYDLSVYDWDTREQWRSRNNWGGSDLTEEDNPGRNAAADNNITFAEGRALEDSAINTWNEIQAYLDERGFFDAWGFHPVALDKLTDRSTYEAAKSSPEDLTPGAAYAPNPADVYAYGTTAPQGFTVTADTASEGYEFEFVANPLDNWRIAVNASQSQAQRNNVGGPELDEYIAYLDSKLTDTPAGDMPQFGNTGLNIYDNVYGPWRANYSLMKLQEGTDAPEIREWRWNVITNYSFTNGVLDGFGVGGAWRYQDSVIIGYPIDPDTRFFDLNNPYHGPAEGAIDLWVSYDRPLTDKVHWSIQLNVRNAFDGDELIPISVQPDRSPAAVRIAPTQEWFLTNTFSF